MKTNNRNIDDQVIDLDDPRLTHDGQPLDLAAAGYQEGLPEWLDSESAAVDYEMVGRMICGDCGRHRTMVGRPFWRAPCSYVMLACCVKCGGTEAA